jgi:esterase/lipase superfamily enzyme
MKAEVKRRLALTPRKDVYLYVHGYNNTFEDAAFALAELWHFFGREGLPIVYTWPAGHPGIFGYTYDRESSEFTVFHLKQVIRWLSAQPEIENIHLIAHSRGTDVATSAFRELVIWARGAGLNPRERFKIKNFVIAASDLDVQVMSQRKRQSIWRSRSIRRRCTPRLRTRPSVLPSGCSPVREDGWERGLSMSSTRQRSQG